jgi:hypothetical protein
MRFDNPDLNSLSRARGDAPPISDIAGINQKPDPRNENQQNLRAAIQQRTIRCVRIHVWCTRRRHVEHHLCVATVPRIPLRRRDVARIVLVTRVQRYGHRQEAVRERGDELGSCTYIGMRVATSAVQYERLGDSLRCKVVPFILAMVTWWNSKLSLEFVRDETL